MGYFTIRAAITFALVVSTAQATAVDLVTTAVYDTAVGCTSAGMPIQVTAATLTTTACTLSTACTITSSMYPAIGCSSTDGTSSDNFKTTYLPSLFGSSPYVVVESYQAGMGCADPTQLSDITAYLADGKCHKTSAVASYIATNSAGGSVTIEMYSDSDCIMSRVTLVATVSQVIGNTCTSSATGIRDTRVYTYGVTPGTSSTTLYLSSTMLYDTNTNQCMPPAVPTQVTTTVVDTGTDCTATSTCSGSTMAPYTGVVCSTTSTFKSDMSTAFGSNPYVTVEKYHPGQACAASELAIITTFLADGKCHQAGELSSYRVTRKADGSAIIQEYVDSVACNTTPMTITVTSAQGTGSVCVPGDPGFQDAKIYGYGVTPSTSVTMTPLYLSSFVSYNSSIGDCPTPALPIKQTTIALSVDNCLSSISCHRSEKKYESTVCTTLLANREHVAAVFGSTPYVIVEKYLYGSGCETSTLSGTAAYLADAKCHKSSPTTSFRASRMADGTATVMTYANSSRCTRSPKIFTAATNQATDSPCSKGSTDVPDTKMYGDGVTPLYLTSTLSYDKLYPMLPTKIMTAVLSVDTCVPSTARTSSGGFYSSTACSSTSTYQTDIAAAFGSNPYVIVEKYIAGKSCTPNQLSGITTYLADGECHQMGTMASYRATRATDSSAKIITYTDSFCDVGAWNMLDVHTAQTSSSSCAATTNGVFDVKIYSSGAPSSTSSPTWYLSSTLSYDASIGNCVIPTAVPSQVVTTIAPMGECTPSTGCITTAPPFTAIMCSSMPAYKTDLAAAFGSHPYVIVEKYNPGQNCNANALAGITAYRADAVCHWINADESYLAKRATDGSAVIMAFRVRDCSGTSTIISVTAVQASGNTCDGAATDLFNTKISGAGETSVNIAWSATYSSNTDCSVFTGANYLVTTSMGQMSCTSGASCGGSTGPYTGTLCSTVSTYKQDLATAFGSRPYLIMESYIAGKNCAGVDLMAITTHLADGICHQTGESTSYMATIWADGSALVNTHMDSACTSTETKTYFTTTQVVGNSCAIGENGVLDKKIYISGVTTKA